LKIFASTNLREKMDSAFLRRMEIQIFLGNPSALARLEWIKRKSKEAEG
jgi:SpoVK/Ycf46/Vps4 family AAA+-type ATPase